MKILIYRFGIGSLSVSDKTRQTVPNSSLTRKLFLQYKRTLYLKHEVRIITPFASLPTCGFLRKKSIYKNKKELNLCLIPEARKSGENQFPFYTALTLARNLCFMADWSLHFGDLLFLWLWGPSVNCLNFAKLHTETLIAIQYYKKTTTIIWGTSSS